MDSTNLRDFRPDPSKINHDNDDDASMSDDGIGNTGYHEEINTLKIDKLSNKVTIISIIIPLMIGAIIVFAYLDMKERVVDVDQTKQSQVEQITLEFDQKISALDVKIAKNRFDLEKELPPLKEKNVSLSGQIAKLNSNKVDQKTLKTQISKLDTKIKNNASQHKTTLSTMERMNKETLTTINANQAQFDKISKEIKNEITQFSEEFDARLLELSDYQQQIGLLRKDLSLLDKKIAKIEQTQVSKTTFQKEIQRIQTLLEQKEAQLNAKIAQLEKKLSSTTKTLNKRIDSVSKSKSTTTIRPSSVPSGPTPQVSIDPPSPGGIQEQPLTQ